MQGLQLSDFDGCGKNIQADYVIQSTELCIILSGVLRKLFGPRISPRQRRDALSEADSALARWSLYLPEKLRLRPTLTLALWPSILHLVYNNVLILLHRPRPHAVATSEEHGPNDADICSAAAGVIQSIYEGLRERDGLNCLWTSEVNALFTAMIQLSVELRISNPILAIAALRRYDSTLYSLRRLAEYWPNAESILHFFEKSARLQRSDLRKVSTYSHVAIDPLNHDRTPQALTYQGTTRSYDPVRSAHTPLPSERNCQPGGKTGGFQGLNASVNDPVEENTELGDDLSSWRQLFPFIDMDHDAEMQTIDFVQSRDEWREIYWQEPGLAEEFFH